ncbi:MAG: cation diffusion facilitator family transporter [Bacteroidota bacterium]
MTLGQQNLRIQKWVVALAVTLFAVKIAAYFLTHSVAILTDALESIVNVVAGFFGLYSLYLSAKPRDEDHPYGHGKIEFISAAVEGTMILIAGVLIIIESIQALISPRELHELDYGILLVASTAALNYIVGTICVRTGTKNNSMALMASGKHLQTDAYSTIGIVLGLLLIFFTDIQWLDSVVAVLFSFVIIFSGLKIIRQSIAGIMDESDMLLLTELVKLLNENRKENWIDLHNVRIIKFGGTLHLDAHLTIPWYLNVHEAHVEIETIARLVRTKFGPSLELFVHSDGCLDFSCRICDKQDCAVRQFAFQRKVEWTVQNLVKDTKHDIDS